MHYAFVLIVTLIGIGGVSSECDEKRDGPEYGWLFSPKYVDGITITPTHGDKNGIIKGTKFKISRFGLDLSGDTYVVAPDVTFATLPKRAFTLAAWVQIDEGLKWGGILTFVQDNGQFEKGWQLIYNEEGRIGASFATTDQVHDYVYAFQTQSGSNHHVVMTYDPDIEVCSTASLFIDGRRVRTFRRS